MGSERPGRTAQPNLEKTMDVTKLHDTLTQISESLTIDHTSIEMITPTSGVKTLPGGTKCLVAFDGERWVTIPGAFDDEA
jgi:hypothetical protein